jgi:hypothetical protein
MVNLLLKFNKNKKNPSEPPMSHYKKKICLVHKQSKDKPKPGEYWECFLWVDYKNFYLVKPFRKINADEVEDEQKKIDIFNQHVYLLEKIQKEHEDVFTKVVFDQENKPYLLSNLSAKKLKEKFEDYDIKTLNKKIVARPKF